MGTIHDARRDNVGSDRAIADRKRHKEKVREKLKEGAHEAIADEAIIGQRKDKKFKIPVRGIKEPRFVFGTNRPMVGGGEGEEGDLLPGPGQPGQGTAPGDAGNEPGEEVYEVDVTLEEIIELLFEELELPYMERKKFREIVVETTSKPKGYRSGGGRLSPKRTIIEKQKRKVATRGDRPETLTKEEYEKLAEEEREYYLLQDDGLYHFYVPFHRNDLKYVNREVDKDKQSNAVVFLMMDVSGSMGVEKKGIARFFFWLLVRFVETKYQNVEWVPIAHHTRARVVTEEEFFTTVESGGTNVSSAYEKMLEIIDQKYSPNDWNIYGFHCSDGDNWSDDNEKAIELAQKLCDVCNLFGYGEIKPENDRIWGPFGRLSVDYTPSSLLDMFEDRIKADNFATVSIKSKEDVWPAFRDMLTHERKESSK